MNIFFLSLSAQECAKLYCDQHVIKILLEITQMLYTAWHKTGSQEWNITAPVKADGVTRGYKAAHPNHPMTMWVRSSRQNYLFTVNLGMCLALEYNKRFNKCHACTKHILWLSQNVPHTFTHEKSSKAFYSVQGIPECMPEEFHNKDIVQAYKAYYTTKSFGRWTLIKK
jgi:hypothetical protein